MTSIPSDEAVQAAIDLLTKIPKRWADLPELSQLQEKALGLLVAGGLVELKVSLLLCGIGDKRAVAVRFRFSGQAGLAQAVAPALEEAWVLWGEHFQPGSVYVARSDEKEAWRLTEHGETAAQEAAGDDVGYLRDFLRTPPIPGMEMMPPGLRMAPGVARFSVSGEGHVEMVKVINTNSEPVRVEVTNLKEVSTPLESIARAVQDTLQRKEEPPKDNLPPKAKNARRRPRKRAPRTALTEQEKRAIDLKSAQFSIKQIANEMSITPQRVGQLLASGEKRLSTPSRSVKAKSYDPGTLEKKAAPRRPGKPEHIEEDDESGQSPTPTVLYCRSCREPIMDTSPATISACELCKNDPEARKRSNNDGPYCYECHLEIIHDIRSPNAY